MSVDFLHGFLWGAGLFCWKAILDIRALRAELDAIRAEYQEAMAQKRKEATHA